MRYISILLLTSLLIFTGSIKYKGIPYSVAASSESTIQSEAPVGLNLGNKAPEISLKDPSGSVIDLSSLRGQLVLIDFWASWCGPCRHENPSIVKAYSLYKDKKFKNGDGFTVYSVSLDANIGAWEKAIKADGLIWPHHVSDLKGWYSEAAAKYRITSIPGNFLINEKGVIINKNLRGDELVSALDKLVIK